MVWRYSVHLAVSMVPLVMLQTSPNVGHMVYPYSPGHIGLGSYKKLSIHAIFYACMHEGSTREANGQLGRIIMKSWKHTRANEQIRTNEWTNEWNHKIIKPWSHKANKKLIQFVRLDKVIWFDHDQFGRTSHTPRFPGKPGGRISAPPGFRPFNDVSRNSINVFGN